MSRPLSKLAPAWWDYTTLDPDILADAARLTARDLLQLSRPGFSVRIFDTVEEFYAAEALEYIEAWRQATPDNPAGICGPIGPTEQLPIVARIVNAIGLELRDAHFWSMDEWIIDGKTVPESHPLSFARCNKAQCFNRIDKALRMPAENLHVPSTESDAFSRSFDAVRCVLMQGGQGEIKHWAFNDPPPRKGKYRAAPPSPEEYRRLGTRKVALHPVTITQNARTSGGGNVALVPTEAITVGPRETWKAETVSIWHPGHHDNPFGIRLTALMISKRIPDAAVPMSLLADHPNVRFSYLRSGIGSVAVEMHRSHSSATDVGRAGQHVHDPFVRVFRVAGIAQACPVVQNVTVAMKQGKLHMQKKKMFGALMLVLILAGGALAEETIEIPNLPTSSASASNARSTTAKSAFLAVPSMPAASS